MKKVRILFWTFTGLFALAMLFPTIPAVIGEQATVEFITEHLGYPEYFVFYSGIVKLLGLLTIVVPGFPRLKEWAYAGLTFDLFSLCYSGFAVGQSIASNAPMLVYFLLLGGSYFYYRKLASTPSQPKTAVAPGHTYVTP